MVKLCFTYAMVLFLFMLGGVSLKADASELVTEEEVHLVSRVVFQLNKINQQSSEFYLVFKQDAKFSEQINIDNAIKATKILLDAFLPVGQESSSYSVYKTNHNDERFISIKGTVLMIPKTELFNKSEEELALMSSLLERNFKRQDALIANLGKRF